MISFIAAFIASMLVTIISETLAWILVRKNETYQRLQAMIEQTKAKIAKLKAGGATGRKIEQTENELRDAEQQATFTRLWATIASGVVLFGLMTGLNSGFSGSVAARLPFEPFSFIRGLSHRTLLGDDWKECSTMFIYIIFSMAVRPTVQKFLGTGPKRGEQPTFF